MLSPWAMAGITLLVGVALVLLFPRKTLVEESRRESRNSPLAAAYLANMLTDEPGNMELRFLLAQKKFSLGAIDEARESLAPVLEVSDDVLRRRAGLLDYDIRRADTYRNPEQTLRYKELQRELLASLKRLAREDWGPPELLYFAREARSLGAREFAAQLTARLLSAPGAVPLNWLVEAGDMSLGDGDYRTSSALYLAARQRATDLEDRRRLFLRAIATLQSGNLLRDAIDTAEQNLGELANDDETLQFLIRLSMAASDPARAQKYVRRLMHMSSSRTGGPALLESMVGFFVASAHAQSAPMPAPRPYEERIYTLAFEVFLANGSVADALRVAEAAVAQRPQDTTWRERLAQVSEWSGKPADALRHWLILGNKTGSDNAWQGVLRLAPGLHDDDALLAAWQHTAERRRLEAAERRIVADLFERLARAQDGVAFFQRLFERSKDPLVFDEIAFLESRAGHSDAAARSFERLIELAGSTPERVVKLATFYVLKADFRRALELLRPLKERAAPADTDFWRLLADVAWQLQDDDTASRAYGILIDRGNAKPFDFERLAQLLRQRQPEESARIAEGLWRNFRNIGGLMVALEIYNDRRDLVQLRRLFESIGPAEETRLRDNSYFCQLRAAYLQASGQPRLALADYARALTLSPNNTELRITVLWLLIDAKLLPELRTQLQAWATMARGTAAYWDVYAAAYVTLGEPRRALPFLARQAANRSQDYLWLVNYADTLEETGDAAMAWRMRRHAWHSARAQLAREPRADATVPRDKLIGYARLTTQFAPGDPSLAVIRHILRQDSGPGGNPGLDAAARELVLAWTISTDQDEASRGWLAQRYGRTLSRPLWAEVSMALADNDLETLDRLLETRADALPRYNRIDAARATQRIALAQSLGFEAQEKYPADDEVHLRLATDLLAGAASLTVRDVAFQRGVLKGTERTARLQVWATQRLRLALELGLVQQRSGDGAQLVGIPGLDRTLALSALYRHDGGETEALVGRRSGLADFTALKLAHSRKLHQSVAAVLSLSSGERALESVPLIIGGQKNEAAASVQYTLSMREFIGARTWSARYATQDGSLLGSGHGLYAEAGHRFRTEYPDLTLRISRTLSHFDASGAADQRSAQLAPSGLVPPAAFFMPQSFRLWGLNLGFGTRYREEHSRGVRPFMDIGRTANSVSGNGYNWLLGAGGSVIGPDHLSAYWMSSRGGGGTNVSVREFGLRYQYYFDRY